MLPIFCTNGGRRPREAAAELQRTGGSADRDSRPFRPPHVKKCEGVKRPAASSLDSPGIGCTGEGMTSRQVLSFANCRGCLILLISAVLASIPTLAHASPPDPTWIPGIYDDADFDDVVGLVTSATALVEPMDAAALRLVSPPTSLEALPRESAPKRLSNATLHARAPPAS